MEGFPKPFDTINKVNVYFNELLNYRLLNVFGRSFIALDIPRCRAHLGNQTLNAALKEKGFHLALGDYYLNKCYFLLVRHLGIPAVGYHHSSL